jgi:AraC-like DNA-binding protein
VAKGILREGVQTGFARGAYLARIFRVQFGMTPGAFRAAAASGR